MNQTLHTLTSTYPGEAKQNRPHALK